MTEELRVQVTPLHTDYLKLFTLKSKGLGFIEVVHITRRLISDGIYGSLKRAQSVDLEPLNFE